MIDVVKNRVDVIIPAYNAHATLFRCLCSVAQQTIVTDVKVTIVDDCSDHSYEDIVDRFKDNLDIDVLRLDENKGPGFARQYGREHSHGEFITFLDADDTFNGAYALHFLRNNLQQDPKAHSCFGSFIEDQITQFVPHQNDTVWVFGKLYRRVFLDKYNICMNSTRSNEDTGFNALVKLCSSEEEQIKFIGDIVYVWHATENSITRANNCDYSFNASFDGYTDNMIWAISEARKRFPFKEGTNYFAVETMCNLYFYYVESEVRRPEYNEKNLRACKRFYETTYKPMEGMVTAEVLAANYNLAARNFILSGRGADFIPSVSIQEFLKKLR